MDRIISFCCLIIPSHDKFGINFIIKSDIAPSYKFIVDFINFFYLTLGTKKMFKRKSV